MTQREILLALIELYNKGKSMIKSKEVADMIGKDEGTVRNVIISLKVLGLVESKPGPNGGYMPTLKAFEYIRNPSVVPVYDKLSIYRNGIETDIKVSNIEILDITNPKGNRVLLKVTGDIGKLRIGETIRIGPTPYSRLVVEGLIMHIDEVRKEIIIDVSRMVSIPKERIGNLLSRKLITVKGDMSIMDVASTFYREAIRGAPVVNNDGKLVGIITTADIMKAFYERKFDAKVEDFMRTNVITITEDEDIFDAIRKMIANEVGRLLVVSNSNSLVGIITRTDILRRIAGLEGSWAI
ncbi:histidine kinase [Sulfolobales archaeon HS-7]|nr:histidine kinase [Sulfolobales archaeon HS-7]